MFTNRCSDGRNNVCGRNVANMRKDMNLSQREIADKLQRMGYAIDKYAIQRIESGQRFVTDIEVQALAAVFDVSIPELFNNNIES